METPGQFRLTREQLDHFRNRIPPNEYRAFSQWLNDYSSQVDVVIRNIEEAFAGVRLENGIGLKEANGLDDYESDKELKKLRQLDEKENWSAITIEELQGNFSSLSFFDAKGFIFHLPAFLIAELNDRLHQDFLGPLIEGILAPPGWHELLTSQQAAALVEVMQLVRKHPMFEFHSIETIDSKILQFRTIARAKS